MFLAIARYIGRRRGRRTVIEQARHDIARHARRAELKRAYAAEINAIPHGMPDADIRAAFAAARRKVYGC